MFNIFIRFLIKGLFLATFTVHILVGRKSGTAMYGRKIFFLAIYKVLFNVITIVFYWVRNINSFCKQMIFLHIIIPCNSPNLNIFLFLQLNILLSFIINHPQFRFEARKCLILIIFIWGVYSSAKIIYIYLINFRYYEKKLCVFFIFLIKYITGP